MPRTSKPKKLYLFQDNQLVLNGGDDTAVQLKVTEILSAPASSSELPKFLLISGVEMPLEIDTGIRVKVGGRKRTKKDNGATKKPKKKEPTATTPTAKAPTTPTA